VKAETEPERIATSRASSSFSCGRRFATLSRVGMVMRWLAFDGDEGVQA
jgi:hypothetical protein